jgi:hypothetical protein
LQYGVRIVVVSVVPIMPSIIYNAKEVINNMKPRIPTREEKIELLGYLLKYDYKNDENERLNIEGFVESASIAVFDNYITSSPGYSGKLMVVVYDGSPWITRNDRNLHLGKGYRG